jgi:uncharacterized protein (DUF342 family)
LTEQRPELIEIEAATPEEALNLASQQAAARPSELRLVETRPIRRMPWQPKRAMFVIERRPPEPEKAPTGTDGAWKAQFREGAVYLNVTAPTGDGRRTRLEEVLAGAKNWPLDEPERDMVTAAVEKAAGQDEYVGYYGNAGGAPFRVVVSPSDEVAYMICGDEPPEGDSKAMVVAALAEIGVTHGVDTECIEQTLEAWEPARAILIARGAEPVAGLDATVEQTFVDQAGQPVIREDGTADFFASQLTPPVTRGTTLAVKHPPTPGTPGYTIRGGEILPQPGKDIDLKKMLGKDVELSEDGLLVIASADGTPSSMGSRYSVLPALRIDGTVGVGTGNVTFPGSITVGGDVLDGFTVKADGDITVRGVVQAATLEATGNVILMAGIFGRERGRIVAGGDVRAAFLNECSVRSEGSVLVSGEIVRSNVTAKTSVQVGGSGKIIGGTISAGVQIVANTIGSPVGRVATRLILPNERGWRADGGAGDADAQPESSSAPVAASARPAAEHPTVTEEVAPSDKAESKDKESTRIAVKVRGVVYPPTHILIGHSRRSIDLEVEYAMFTEGQGEITMAPFA